MGGEELPRGAVIGVMLIVFAAILALGLGVFHMETDLLNETLSEIESETQEHIQIVTEQEIFEPKVSFVKITHVTIILFCLGFIFLVGGLQITIKDIKYGIVEYIEPVVEQTVYKLKDEIKADSIKNLTLSTYDLLQYRKEMIKIGLLTAFRCRVGSVQRSICIVIPRTKTIQVSGIVSISSKYYVVDNTYILMGGVILPVDTYVNLELEVPISYESTIGIFSKYKVRSLVEIPEQKVSTI